MPPPLSVRGLLLLRPSRKAVMMEGWGWLPELDLGVVVVVVVVWLLGAGLSVE